MAKNVIRAKGEGSVFKRESTGKWIAQVFIAYKPNGQPQYTTKTCDTKKEAGEALEVLKREVNSGYFDPKKTTVGEYLAEWLKTLTNSARARELYTRDVEKQIVPRIGHVLLTRLRASDVDRMLNDVKTKSAGVVAGRNKTVPEDAGVRTAQLVRDTLRNALNKAVKKDLIPSNPVVKTDAPKKQKKEMDLWTPSETLDFLYNPTIRVHRLYALFYLMTFSGLRRGEAMALRWSDLKGVNLRVERSLSYVGGKVTYSTTKTERSKRWLSLSEDVLAVLAAHKAAQDAERAKLGARWQDEGLMFPSEVGKPILPSNYSKLWKTLLKNAGVRHVTPHCLRHLAASLMIRKGATLNEVSERLGHAKSSFTGDVYVHVFEEMRQRNQLGINDLRGESPKTYN